MKPRMNQVAKNFNGLTLDQKSRLVNNYGKWIWFTDYKEYRISVYQIRGAIIEVWYDYKEKAIWRIRIPSYEQLDIHLNAITLPLT